MKKIKFLVLLIVSILVLAACNSSKEEVNSSKETNSSGKETKTETETIKIAGIHSLSGGASPLGEPIEETLKMLVELQNEAGGINGKKIEYITYDDKSDQNEAVLAMKKAITQDKVAAVIGGSISGNALAMVPIAEQNKVPFVATAASRLIYEDEAGKQRGYVFKVSPDDTQAVEKILEYLKAKGLTNVAWLNVANNYGTGGLGEFEKMAADYGVNAVIKDEFEATVKDAKPMLTRVKKENPQAIIVWGTVQESAVVVKNIRELGLEQPIIGSHGISSAQMIELAGDAGNGLVFPSAKPIVVNELENSDPQKEVILQLKEQYEGKYNKPISLFTAHAWDAFYIVTKAIEAKGTDGTEIKEYIENDLGEFIGQDGVFNINPEDHNGLSVDSLVMVKIENGKWVLEQ